MYIEQCFIACELRTILVVLAGNYFKLITNSVMKLLILGRDVDLWDGQKGRDEVEKRKYLIYWHLGRLVSLWSWNLLWRNNVEGEMFLHTWPQTASHYEFSVGFDEQTCRSEGNCCRLINIEYYKVEWQRSLSMLIIRESKQKWWKIIRQVFKASKKIKPTQMMQRENVQRMEEVYNASNLQVSSHTWAPFNRWFLIK